MGLVPRFLRVIVRSTLAVVIVLVAVIVGRWLVPHAPPVAAVEKSHWKTFTSRGGWSIRYPENWQVLSCHTCTDPTEAGLFVIFYDPEDTKHGLMVDPIVDRAAGQNEKAWFDSVKTTANLNPIVEEASMKVDGRPARRVLYQHKDGSQADDIYVLNGSHGYQIGDMDRVQPAYPVYQQMLASFHFTDGAEK